MIKRILAISLIFICAWIAWGYLSHVMHVRTDDVSASMSDAVGGLWGTSHCQESPVVEMTWEEQVWDDEAGGVVTKKHRSVADLAGSDISVDLNLDYRKKGLLWFSTYNVSFDSRYSFKNREGHEVEVTISFPYPSESAVYDNMVINLDDREDVKLETKEGSIGTTFSMEPGSSRTVQFSYRSRGLDQWTYRFGEDTRIIKDFRLVMNTNFDAIDFPRNSISPDSKQKLESPPGWTLTWEKESLVSAFQIGMVMPRRLNPGPLAAAMSGNASVSLLFYFFVIFMFQVLRDIKIHPMNYFFLAASFFAFNLLFSYLVDHVDVKLAFAISSLVSLFLVVSYLRLVVGARFALVEAGISQLVYQVLFSLAHFFEGFTGLTITIGAIVTLAVVMRLTAKIDWEQVFRDREWGRLPRFRKAERLPGPVVSQTGPGAE